MKRRKSKFSYDQLYNRIIERGITNSYYTKDKVIDILQSKNYYYRLIGYRKNFRKTKSGYTGLDIKALYDLSSVDTYLREYLFTLCLDVEHTTKTLLMNSITENEYEDGYNIVEQFKTKYPDRYEKNYRQFSYNKYKKDMFEKRKEISVWVLLEIIDFGSLLLILELYIESYPDFKDIIDYDILAFTKNIRNACVHNDLFIINIYDSEKSKIKKPKTKIVSYAHEMGLSRTSSSFFKIHDLVALFANHKKLCSPQLNKRRHNEGYRVLNRGKENIELYNTSPSYHTFFSHLNLCVDYLIQ